MFSNLFSESRVVQARQKTDRDCEACAKLHFKCCLIAKSSFPGRWCILINTGCPEMVCILNDLIGSRFGANVGVEFIGIYNKRFALINGLCSVLVDAGNSGCERMAHYQFIAQANLTASLSR